MKKFLFILLFLFFILPSYSAIITGEVEYNAESASDEIFSNPIKPLSFEKIRPHLFDANAKENIFSLMSGITELKDRKVAQFSDGSYGVIYLDDPLYTWIYKNGKLINFIEKSSLDYPAKTTRYRPDGSVINVGLKVSNNESFIYSPDGKLIAHWLGKLCYDSSNNVIMTRKNIE